MSAESIRVEEQVAQVMSFGEPDREWRYTEIENALCKRFNLSHSNAKLRTWKGLKRLETAGKVHHTGRGRQGTWSLGEGWTWYYYHLSVLEQVAMALQKGQAKKRSEDPRGVLGAENQPVLVHLVKTHDFQEKPNQRGGKELWDEVMNRFSHNPGLIEPFLFRFVAFALSLYPGDTFLLAYPVIVRGGMPEWRIWPTGPMRVIPDWSILKPKGP